MYNTYHTPFYPTPPHPRGSESERGKLTLTEIRGIVVKEILWTERDYVKHLEDIVEVKEGWLHEVLVLKEMISQWRL